MAVASAGPYASLHLAPERQPRQHLTTQITHLNGENALNIIYSSRCFDQNQHIARGLGPHRIWHGASHKLIPALETVVTVMVKSVYIELVLSWPCVNAWWWWCSFESGSEKSDRVSKACRQIQLTHHSKPAYLLNVSVAYDILCQIKGICAKSVFSFLRQLSTWHCPRLLLSARCAAAPLLNAGRAEID